MKKQALINTLEKQLRAVRQERQAPTDAAALAALKRYQRGRLAATHADLLAAPDSHDAALFFLDELYGAHDLGQRDLDLERIIPTMQRMLSYEALRAVTEAIMLEALSERLDGAMARTLGAVFTDSDYAAAYRQVGTRAERTHQLTLIEGLGGSMCALVRVPLLSLTLAAMRVPARIAGLDKLQQFLERGFDSFRKMRDPAQFVSTVVRRERELMTALYDAGAPQPDS